MKNYKNISLKPSSTIKEALEVINKGSLRIALVVANDKLLGVISDPDIRRAMLNSTNLEESIDKIYNKVPFTCNINDSKEFIIQKAIEKNIYEIPIVDDENNLISIETLTHLLQQNSYFNKVVLMVGGLGTRLRPLTNDTPKPMLKVGNKPILETIISNFKKYGFINIILSVSYKAEMIEKYFGDGSAFGVNIEYIYENKRMGTAGALSLIKEKLKEPFFVMNGDLLTNINFKNMMEYHTSNSSIATMGVREYDFQVPYGVVNMKNGKILGIEEKPVHKFFVSGGVYVFSKKALEFIPEDTYYDMPTLFEDIISKGLNTISFPIHEYWLDIGRIEEFEKANSEFYEVFSV